jgi:WD40 repeat protein
MQKIKVLLFAASPRGTARLDLPREFREIDEEIRRGKFRDDIELILVPGTRPVDLLHKLNESQPQIVHFSSHGSPGAIFLEAEAGEHGEAWELLGIAMRSDPERDMTTTGRDRLEEAEAIRGEPQPVRETALVDVLRSCDEGNLRLVVLNACDTRPQAEALTEVVDCVVSMKQSISDRAAIKFAASFYGALAFGLSVQKAFDQGVARLRLEGLSETGTPDLLARAGVDASRVVLIGSTPERAAPPAAEVPFLVPFPRNADFVGRDGDLARLHAALSGPGPVGIRPAGLTGMGGIGKTQLAVEYVHRHRSDYPDGIFWIDAAGPLADGFARLAADGRLKWAEPDQPRDEQIRAAFAALNRRPQGLLVLDNVPDPAMLAVPVLAECVPEDLHCRLLFTTRRHDLGRFAGIELTVLAVTPALRLLLRHPSRQAALHPDDPDHEHARAIARMLGRLPLALELAGAYLGKYSGDVTLQDYREGLKSDGALATLDADVAELTEADLRRVHAPAVAATIREQWEALGHESARLLLRVASLFAESAATPIARLGLLAGLADEAPPGRPSPLRRAFKRLEDACLVERLEGDRLRVHPLIHEFVARQTPRDEVEDFRRDCALRAASALEFFPSLEALDRRRGLDGLQEDLIAILELCPSAALDIRARLQALLRLLQREAHNLRVVDQQFRPTLFAQQVRNRAFLLGISPLQSTAEHTLSTLGPPYLRLLWTASRESPALVRTLTGHEDWVNALALTPDGRYALSGSNDRTLKLWDVATGQSRLTFRGHTGPVHAVAISPDGRDALSGSTDATLMLWDMTSGQPRLLFGKHEGPVYAVAITPDARHVLSASRDEKLRLWELRTGQLCATFTSPQGPLHAMAITPDGSWLLAGSTDGSLNMWDLRSGQFCRAIVGHQGPVIALAITPDGHHVLSGSLDGTLRLWDLRSGEVLMAFVDHGDATHKAKVPVYALAVTPDGRQVLSAGATTIRLWDLASGKLCGSFVGHERGVSAVAVTPDGRYAISGSTDETLKLWDLGQRPAFLTFGGHQERVTVVALTPDGRQALSGSRDSTMRLWDLGSRQPEPTLTRHEDWVTSLAVTPDGRHAVSGCEDCILRLWDLRTGQLRSSLTGHNGGVTAVSVTPDGRHALSGSRDGTLKLWDLATAELALSFGGNEALVTAVAITPDGRQAISGFFDGTLKVWDLQTGELVRTMSGQQSCAGAVEITSDGKTVVPDWSVVSHPAVSALAITTDGRSAISGSCGDSAGLRFWDLSTGKMCFALGGHEDGVTAIAVTPNGQHALSAATDRTLRLWNLEARVCQAMARLENAPMAIAVARDGQTVVVGDRVGNVHHFQIHGM